MQPHPRIRKTIKWGGLALTVLLVVVWIGSQSHTTRWTPGKTLVVEAGPRGLWLARIPAHRELLLELHDDYYKVYRDPDWLYKGARGRVSWQCSLPLWLLPLPPAGATAVALCLNLVARRKAFPDACSQCRYDRTGLASPGGVCPECGSPPPRHP